MKAAPLKSKGYQYIYLFASLKETMYFKSNDEDKIFL